MLAATLALMFQIKIETFRQTLNEIRAEKEANETAKTAQNWRQIGEPKTLCALVNARTFKRAFRRKLNTINGENIVNK